MKKLLILLIIIGISATAYLCAQEDAYGQLRRAAGSDGYVTPVNGPVPVGEESSYENTSNSDAQIIANYQYKAVSVNNLGVDYQNSGNYGAAIRAYKKALWYDPYNETARANLASAREARRMTHKNNRNARAYEKAEAERRAIAEKERLAQEERDRAAQRERELAGNNSNSINTHQTTSDIILKKAEIEAEKATKDLEEAKLKLVELKTSLDNTNKLLKMYSKSLANNSAELDSWGETVDKTYANTLKVSQEYFMQMFLKYSLLTNFDPKYKNGPYQKLEELLQSSDPVKKQWLLTEFADKNLNPDDVSKFVDLVMANTDAAAISSEIFFGDPENIKTQLDAVLFINSVFEAKEWVKYDELKDCPMFKQMANAKGKTMPGDWYTQAKVIGEVYSDLVVQCVSWKTINRLNEDSESMTQKVNMLIYKQDQTMKQIDCLENCIDGPDGKCMNKCTGKSKLHTPPPFLD